MSTLPTPNPPPVSVKSAPSCHVLDDTKKAQIVALIAGGFSRRMAAKYVLCVRVPSRALPGAINIRRPVGRRRA